MRWKKSERSTGEAVALVVLLAWFVSAVSPSRVRDQVLSGMTQDHVAAALRAPGRPHPTKFGMILLHSPAWFSNNQADYEKYVRDTLHRNSNFYREYRLPFCTVDVYFVGEQGEERVKSVEARRALNWRWQDIPWLGGALAFGLLAAEAARRHRAIPAAEASGEIARRL